MPTVNTFTDYSAEQQALERRRRMAEMLSQQSMQPIEQVAPNAPISWTQGLAKALQGFQAGREERDVGQRQKDLTGRRNQALAEALGAMPKEQTSNLNLVNTDDEGNPMPAANVTTQPTMQDNAAWLGRLAQVGPDAVQMGTGLMGMQQKANESDENRAWRNQQAQEARAARMQELQLRLADARITAQERADLARELAQMRGDTAMALKEMGRGIAGAQPITAVTLQDPKNPNATIVVDGRTGRLIGQGPKSTDVGKMENKRQFNMQGIGQAIQEAEDLLSGAGGKPLPTGSGVGTLYDKAAGFFGASPEGAAEAQKLSAVGGALVSKMPRMEGPQSDKDVQLYRESAGLVGDSTIPIARRKAALETVKSLWSKYERLNPGTFSAPTSSGWEVVR